MDRDRTANLISRLVYEKRFDFSRYDPADGRQRRQLILMLRQASIECDFEEGISLLQIAAARGGTTSDLTQIFEKQLAPKFIRTVGSGVDVAVAKKLHDSWTKEFGELSDPVVQEKMRKTVEFLMRPPAET